MTAARRQGGTVVDGRQYAVGLEGSVITFECARAGHRYTQDFNRGPVTKRITGAGLRLMADWWSKAKGGCIGQCPTCQRQR